MCATFISQLACGGVSLYDADPRSETGFDTTNEDHLQISSLDYTDLQADSEESLNELPLMLGVFRGPATGEPLNMACSTRATTTK